MGTYIHKSATIVLPIIYVVLKLLVAKSRKPHVVTNSATKLYRLLSHWDLQVQFDQLLEVDANML